MHTPSRLRNDNDVKLQSSVHFGHVPNFLNKRSTFFNLYYYASKGHSDGLGLMGVVCMHDMNINGAIMLCLMSIRRLLDVTSHVRPVARAPRSISRLWVGQKPLARPLARPRGSRPDLDPPPLKANPGYGLHVIGRTLCQTLCRRHRKWWPSAMTPGASYQKNYGAMSRWRIRSA